MSEILPWHSDVFVTGENGVHTYRIPAMVQSSRGTLLVFCEARKESQKDASPTDMVLKRSLDGGRTWLPIKTLVRGAGTDAVMNPVAVVDGKRSVILLVCCVVDRETGEEHRQHLMLSSRDEGRSWTTTVDMGQLISDYDDTFVPGPGCGIQTRTGRLVVPGYTCSGRVDGNDGRGLRSRVIYSDDHGDSWCMGEPVDENTNESQVIELSDGRLMLNMRQRAGRGCRAVAISEDGGESWGPVSFDSRLNECPCQASLIRHPHADREGKALVLFANPDISGESYGDARRRKMTVRVSYDEGATWPVKKLVHPGPSSYSGLAGLPNGDVGLVFEGGYGHRREWIRFTRLPLAWITDNQ